MRKLLLLSVFILLMLTAACSQGEQTTDGPTDETLLEPIEVDLQAPEQVEPHTEVTLQAVVTQAGEYVDDASEVEFEFWEEGFEDDSEMISADHLGEGTYAVEKTFDKEGIYYVYSHVTARDMHRMPKAKIVVGNPDVEASVDEHDEEGDHHHHHADIAFHLEQPDSLVADEDGVLTVHLQLEDEPLAEADVTLEMWQAGDEKREWVDLDETAAGTYENTVNLPETGTWHVKIHVEKDDLHEHPETTIDVK